MVERIICLTKKEVEGQDKPGVEGVIIDAEKGVELRLTTQESEQLSTVIASIERYSTRGKQTRAIEGVRKLVNQIAEEAENEPTRVRELRELRALPTESDPSSLTPTDRSLI